MDVETTCCASGVTILPKSLTALFSAHDASIATVNLTSSIRRDDSLLRVSKKSFFDLTTALAALTDYILLVVSKKVSAVAAVISKRM